MQNTDSPAVLQTAEKAGKMAFGWDSDMSQFGPHAHLASAVVNWAPYYKKAIQDVLSGTWKVEQTWGTWKVEQTWWGVKEGAIDLVHISDLVPAATKAKVEAVKKGLSDGSFVIWKGPLKDQSGKEMLKAGEAGDAKDAAWPE